MKKNKFIKLEGVTRIYDIPQKQNVWMSMFRPKTDKLVAVDNVTIEIDRGESVALLGPNGAGKTTTLKMLTGLLHPTNGSISVMGYNPVERDEEYLKQIAMVMGNKNGLPWDLSSRHGYKLFESIYDLDHIQTQKNINELVEVLDVGNCLDRPIRKLSLGQRLKMELIGALLHKPKILFLDEPTLGLDIIAKKNIRDFLKSRNKKEETTIILTSHDMADVEKVSDRVVVINQGKKVYDGQISDLLKKYQKSKYMTITFEEELKTPPKIKGVKLISQKGGGYIYTFEVPARLVAFAISELAKNNSIDDIDIQLVPLEEIIGDIFRGEIKT
jgi:ABC-2 type transport system ATP-binding protein